MQSEPTTQLREKGWRMFPGTIKGRKGRNILPLERRLEEEKNQHLNN